MKPSLVNKSFNLPTTNAQRIDLTLNVWSCDIISPMLCLTSLNILAELWCHQGPFSATYVCLLLLECPTLFN